MKRKLWLWLGLPHIRARTLACQTWQAFCRHDMDVQASALAFHTLFSLFPFCLFLLALVGVLHVEGLFELLRTQAAVLLPSEVLAPVEEVLDHLQTRRLGLLSFGMLLTVFSASTAMRFLIRAMNRIYGVKEARPLWQLLGISIGYTLGIAGLLLAAAGLLVIGPKWVNGLAAHLGLEQLVMLLWGVLRWPLVVVLLSLAVALIYYVTPDVHQRFRFITPGSVLAVAVWLLGSMGFGVYVQYLANYSATYGSIGALIVLLLYLYLSTAVLLLGAELNAVIAQASLDGAAGGEPLPPEVGR